jgi:sulfur carrier protein
MLVQLRNPRREIEVTGPRTVGALLEHLDLVPESVLVIRNDTLVTHDARLAPDDRIEVRPVISGGAQEAIHP